MKPTWRKLVALEPGLQALLDEIKAIDGSHPNFCANACFFGFREGGSFKRRMTELVGWLARLDEPALKTSAAYDVAYEALYGALPDCKDCACPGRPE